MWECLSWRNLENNDNNYVAFNKRLLCNLIIVNVIQRPNYMDLRWLVNLFCPVVLQRRDFVQSTENTCKIIFLKKTCYIFIWFLYFIWDQVNVYKYLFSDQHSKTQRYSLYNNIKQRIVVNPHVWETGTSWTFLLDKFHMINPLSGLLMLNFLPIS